MAARWPFFDDLLSKIEMVCAKADMEIARLYVETLGGDVRLFERLRAEYDATVSAILRIRESDVLMRDTPVIQSAIMLRNHTWIRCRSSRWRCCGDGQRGEGTNRWRASRRPTLWLTRLIPSYRRR
jgi:hypothetical protein